MSRQPPAEIIACAQNSQKKYSLWASLSLAQGIIESAWFTKCSGQYNFFGIKARSGSAVLTHEYISGRSIAMTQIFANYSSAQDAFDAHAELLIDPNGHYKSALNYLGNDLEKYIKAIAPIYATDPHYADSLINLIHSNNLVQYDLAVQSASKI